MINLFKLPERTFRRFFKHIVILIIGLSPMYSYSQEYTLGSIVPPSPNAASLGKYGGIEPNLSSGAINMTVPLATFKSNKLSLPISLSYTSTGFKVDEIASRVGTGWSLNAGGVIARTVFGVMDEYSPRARPTEEQFELYSGRQMVNFMNDITGQADGVTSAQPDKGYDGQPDIFNFNFNGYTGQFILKYRSSNLSGTPFFDCVLLNHSGLKIESGLRNTVSAGYFFKVTDLDGVQYIFNDEEISVQNNDAITGISNGCSNLDYTAEIPSAFYLTKIIHPNHDTINFSYTPRTIHYATGTTQTIYHADPLNPPQTCEYVGMVYPTPVDITCTNTLKTYSIMLSEISSTAGGKIKLNYVDRTDYDDQLLASLEIYQPGQTTAIKKMALGYQYANNRPFLTDVTEKDSSNSAAQKYHFSYNSLDQVPPLLSYSQDHWGYFNGKSNSTMIPVPTDPIVEYYLPQATANREPDANYGMVGLLSSVKYPTGGKDTITYEGNQSYNYHTIYPSQSDISVTGDGSAWPNSTYSSNAVLSYKQVVTLTANVDDNTINPDDPDIYVRLNNITTNTVVYQKLPFTYNESISERLLLDPGTYQIEIAIYGNATVHATLDYKNGSIVDTLMNADAGGVRVAKVVTTDPVTNTSSVKKFNYSLFNNSEIVSATDNPYENYSESILVYADCVNPEGGNSCGTWLSKGFFSMHSNSLHVLYATSADPVTYANVTEVSGENAEDGMVQHEFTVLSDTDPTVRFGRYVTGTPTNHNNLSNGKELYTGVFKKTSTGFLPVKKTFIHYMDDSRRDSTITGFCANRSYDFNCPTLMLGEPTDAELNAYNLTLYSVYRKWIYPDTTRVQTFDDTGLNYTEEVKVEEYGDPYHALITKEQDADSKGNMFVTTLSYPTDFAPSAPYNDMVNEHILSPVIDKSLYKNSTFLHATRTNYANWGGTIYMPETIQSKVGTNSFETRLHYYNYDGFGNPTCVSQEGGPKTTYLYSYSGMLPVAEIRNADYSSIESVLGATTISNFSKEFPTKSAVDSFLAPLATGLPSSYLSKMVYMPIIGMTSSTDEKGQTIYYEYDSFLRLLNIKDQYGNIVKHTDYHYQNQ